jgi:tetratricopeptide (TPR) repeat protein
MSIVATERYLDRLYEAELHLVALSHAEEYLESQASRRQQQALAALSQLPVSERERLTTLLGTPEGKQALSEAPAEQLLLDAVELNNFHHQATATLDGELRDLASYAREAVRNAALHTGRERSDDLTDAHNLLTSALKNPIAARNPALWFEMGWTLWKQENLPGAEDAFYQAVRLSSGSNERFVHHALRHLAFVQAALGKGEEAYQSAQRFLPGDDADPQRFLEAARYAALAKALPEAGKLVGKALEADPAYIGALFAEPDLASLGDARIQALEQITQNARAETETEARRWRRAVGQIAEIEGLLGRTIPLPMELTGPGTGGTTETLSLFAAQRMAQRNAQNADTIQAEGRTLLIDALSESREAEERLRKRIELLHSEVRRWESELKSVTEEAERGKISLHPYNWENPLTPRRNAQARHLREIYVSCKNNLGMSEKAVQDQLPEFEQARTEAQERIKKLEQALTSLDASVSSVL